MNNLIFQNPAIGSVDMVNDEYVRLESITGVSAIAEINTQSTAGQDGSSISSKKVPERQILVRFRVRKGRDAEQAMHDMYRIFSVMSSGTMTFIGRLGSSKIDYVVQSIDIPPNQETLRGVVTLLCPDPYFRAPDNETAPIAGLVSMFKFTFTFPDHPFYISRRFESLFANVYNDGESGTGCTIVIKADSVVVNPALISVETGDEARLNFTMQAGDEIRISTKTGNKKITLTRNGETSNIFGRIKYPFTFLQLAQGNNTFKYDAEEGIAGLNIVIEFTAKYGALYTNAPHALDIRTPD